MQDILSKALPFVEKLDANEQKLIYDNLIEIHYQKGAILYHGSEECTGLLIMKNGRARAFINSDNGGEITLYRLLELDVCVMSASCAVNSLNFNISIEIEEDADIYVIPKNIFKILNEKNPLVKSFTMEIISSRFSEVVWVLEQLVFSNMGKRLAGVLEEHYILNNSKVLKITHEAIAKDLGTAREVVSRLLKQFEINGIVKLSRGTIEIVDMEKLKNI